MATADVWRPPKGPHDVSVGPVLQAALDNLDGTAHSGTSTEYYSFRYNFRPESLDASKNGRIHNIEPRTNDHVAFKLEQASTVGEDRHTFAGVQSPAKDFECVLIYDEATGDFTLEKVESWIDLKYDRAASSTNGTSTGRTLSPLDDNSPTSRATLSSPSPPTPHQQEHDIVQTVQSNLDLELEILLPPPPPATVRPKPRAKAPPTLPLNGAPAGAKGKGKRPRDDGGVVEPPPSARPTKKVASPKRAPVVALPPPPPPALSLPARPPTPPSARQPSPKQFVPLPGSEFHFDSDEEEESSMRDVLTVDEEPPLLTPSIRAPFSQRSVEEQTIESMFDFDEEDAVGEEDDDVGEGEIEGNEVGIGGGEAEVGVDDEDDEDEDDEDDEFDEFGMDLEQALNQDPSVPTKVPMSLNKFAGGEEQDDDDDDDDDEYSDDDSE
ncbi:hypothetical protein FRB94_006768 [Tulasnella sp. JGI-2019a]|nr:hypothetical protein FRB94_006768 [Tulasnella sp. JGI-2019a]KAG9016233.1 hypothetical protein FRB93_011707 [Tulasnella sp. JGI-2019a]KAG9036452.1 hypothetical protein FRB95_008750 [Tulasnella sp. JGI-2019a]